MKNNTLIAFMIFVLILFFIDLEYKKSKQALVYSAIQRGMPEDVVKLIGEEF